MSNAIKIALAHIVITMNAVTHISKQVWPWEVPVYEDKFGDACHVEDRTTEVEVAELPDAQEEYDRMALAFGQDAETKQGIVERTFGRGRVGLEALSKEMHAGIVKPKKAVAPKLARDAAKPQADAADDDDEGAGAGAGAGGGTGGTF